MTQRIAGHFHKEEHRQLLPEPSSNNMSAQMKAMMDDILADDMLCEARLSRKMRGAIQQTRDSLDDAFLSLESPKDLKLLKVVLQSWWTICAACLLRRGGVVPMLQLWPPPSLPGSENRLCHLHPQAHDQLTSRPPKLHKQMEARRDPAGRSQVVGRS